MKQITMILAFILLLASIVMEVICQNDFAYIKNTANRFMDAGISHMSSKQGDEPRIKQIKEAVRTAKDTEHIIRLKSAQFVCLCTGIALMVHGCCA